MRSCSTLGVAVLLVFLAVPSLAQSGRRIPANRPSQPPAAAPAPAPPSSEPDGPAPAPSPESGKIAVVTAKDRPSFGLREDICDAVVTTCARELNESSIARPMPSDELSRKQAIDLAKGGSESYVLWFQFSFDAIADDPMATVPNSNDALLVATFVLFEPVTAKIRTQGRIYFRSFDSYSQRGPSLGGVTRGATGISPTETGLKVASIVLGELERDLLRRP